MFGDVWEWTSSSWPLSRLPTLPGAEYNGKFEQPVGVAWRIMRYTEGPHPPQLPKFFYPKIAGSLAYSIGERLKYPRPTVCVFDLHPPMDDISAEVRSGMLESPALPQIFL